VKTKDILYFSLYFILSFSFQEKEGTKVVRDSEEKSVDTTSKPSSVKPRVWWEIHGV